MEGLLKFLGLLLILPLLFSFSFRPMSQTIDLNEGQKTILFHIENSSKEIIPVTVKVFERIQKEDGTESLPIANEIKVFPPQLIVSPGEKKSIRVDWTGPSTLEHEKAYRIVAEQVPINVKKKGMKNRGGIKMLLKYMNVLYVNPGKTKSDVIISKFKNDKKLRIYLENKGSRHQYLRNVKISFNNGKDSITLSKDSLVKLEGQNILAKSKRYFDIDIKRKIPEEYRGSITFDE